MKIKTIGVMNSLEVRKPNLKKILPTLIPQFDKFILNTIDYNNDIKDIDCFNVGDKGSEYRLIHYNQFSYGYYFCLDDDILYPDDYVKKMVELSKELGVVGVHGYIQGKRHNFRQSLNGKYTTNRLGVGTVCIPCGLLDIDISNWERNKSDEQFSNLCKASGVDMYVVPRKYKWLTPLPDYGKSIYRGTI